MINLIPGTHTESGIVFNGECLFGGVLLATDGIENPTITIYDGTDNTGTVIFPTTEFDASTLGLNGYMPAFTTHCKNGIYIEIATDGSVEAVVYYKDRRLWGIG